VTRGSDVKEWIIFLVGALGGSLVGSGATIYTYHHKLRDEKRNRDRDQKQQAYMQYANYMRLLFHEIMFMADVRPIARQIVDGAANDDSLKELHQVTTRFNANVEQLEESMMGALNELVMLAPKHVRDAAVGLLGVFVRLTEELKDIEKDEIETTEETYNKAMYEFRVAARSDLDIGE
jgi:hypothetical protein